MSTFTWIPDYDSAVDITPRARVAQFGDGYSQRVPDGINRQPRDWDVTFFRKNAEADAIFEFLKARDGVESFDWTPPYEDPGKWVAATFKRSVPNAGMKTVTAIFKEVFGD